MLLQATHTHLYPGHEGGISGISRLAELQVQCDCLVEFADGSVTCARISRLDDGWRLHADSYRTAAGTDIAARRWRIRLDEYGGGIRFRILERLPGPDEAPG